MDSEVAVDTRLIKALSEGIGPRPPTSNREHVAAEVIAGELEKVGLFPEFEEFESQRSFGPTYLVIFVLSLLAAWLGRSDRKPAKFGGWLCGMGAASLGAAESRFALRSPLNLLRQGKSQNVWAAIEPSRDGEPEPGYGPDRQSGPPLTAKESIPDQHGPERTICLVSHMDSSRSGLMFHPRVTPHLGKLVGLSGMAVAINALAPALDLARPGRWLLSGARGWIAVSAGLILEREIRGIDVAGANDNASGVAACLNLARHFTGHPLENSRLVVLVTGSEESGVIGMRDFLRNHDTEGWLFINFDGVSANAPLRVLSRENGPTGKKADRELLDAGAEVGRRTPELLAQPLLDGSGLPYDATAVMARGGRAITIVNQDGPIPDYHWPTDTANRVSEEAFGRAIRFAAALVRELDAKA